MFRPIDPLTSKMSAARVNKASCDLAILNYLCEEGSANTYVISQMIERKETTVSSALSRLRREGKVHEVGMDESSETGHQRIIWAYGPSPDGSHVDRPYTVNHDCRQSASSSTSMPKCCVGIDLITTRSAQFLKNDAFDGRREICSAQCAAATGIISPNACDQLYRSKFMEKDVDGGDTFL
jgi:hypothetical protein